MIITRLTCTAHGVQPGDPERALSYCPECGRFLHPTRHVDMSGGPRMVVTAEELQQAERS